jgi:ribosomal-protein-alanine N-acetyltransferase
MSSAPEKLHPLIRNLTADDLARVNEIEQSAYPYPWTTGIFDDCLRVGYQCTGLQTGRLLVGYAIQSQAVGESHLLNLCISPDWQGMGYGALLLDHAIHIARKQDCESMFLEVRPSNPVGLGLYERRGFVILGRRPDYYRSDQGREDAIIMNLLLRG